MDCADIAVLGGRESLRRARPRLTQVQDEEHARRALFQERIQAVRRHERRRDEREREVEQPQGTKRRYSHVSDTIRELIVRSKLDCGCTAYGVEESTACKIVSNFRRRGSAVRKPVGGFKGGVRIVNEEQSEWLKETQVRHNDWTLKQLQRSFVEQFQENCRK